MTATALAADTATLCITPDQTAVTADGKDVKITYTISVSPPDGREIGVFSFRLKPSGDMVLPTQAKENGERVIGYLDTSLRYDINTDSGIFKTFEYTPESCFFAAVGSREGHRMTEAARIMTITATVPAGSSGAYVLDAEFTVAPDGSGETYIGKVETTPVVITDPDAKTSTQKTVVVSDQDEPVAGQKPDTENKVETGSGIAETVTKWYCNGQELTGDSTFAPGQVYTVEIRVKLSGGAFDTAVYTNSGYTVERLSDTELILRRSYYVEEQYTQALTEEEAQTQMETVPAEEAPAEASEEAPLLAEMTPAKPGNHLGIVAAIAVDAMAVAAAVCQLTIPGGLAKLFSRRKK